MLPDKLTIYHRELREACAKAEGGRLLVKFVGERARVLDSQYAGKPAFAPFVLAGDTKTKPGDRKYQLEHEGLRAVIDAIPRDIPVWIRAEGKREDAAILVWREDGTPIVPDSPAAVPNGAAPSWPTAPTQPAPNPEPTREVRSHEEEFWGALLLARRIVQTYERHFGRPPSDEELRIANSLLIEHNRGRSPRPLTNNPPKIKDLK